MVSDANLTLQETTTRTASGAGPTTELGAQCDGRGMAARVIVTALTGAATFSVEHSADGASWATAGTVIGGTVYAPGEYVILFATARRYIRLAVALAGGSPSVTYSGDLVPQRFGEGRERRLVIGEDAPQGPAILFADVFADGLADPRWTDAGGNSTIDPTGGPTGGPALVIEAFGRVDLAAWDNTAPPASRVFSIRADCWYPTAENPVSPNIFCDGTRLSGLYNEGPGAFSLFLNSADNGDNSYYSAETFDPPREQWVTVEWVYDASGTDPVARWYQDGVPIATATDTGAETRLPDFWPQQVRFGQSAAKYANISVADGLQGV